MKKLTTSLAVLLLGTALTHAANIPSDDLILGFQSGDTGSAYNVLFDLGSAATLAADAGSGTVVNLSADFSLNGLSVYGSSPDALEFGVVGTPGTHTTNGVTADTIFVGSEDGTVPQRQTDQSSLESSEFGIYAEYNQDGSTPTGETGPAIGKTVSSGDTASYSGIAGTDGTYNGNFNFETQAQFTGSGTQTLALYEVIPGATGDSKEFGTLSLNDTTGALTFTATSSPEPSTYLMMGLGLGVFAIVMRRRMANNA